MATLFEHWTRWSLHKRGFESRTVQTSVGAVHVLSKAGQGALPWAVFIHGFGSAATYVSPLAERLLAEVKGVHLVDLPGHSFSPVPVAGMTGPIIRDAVFETVETLESPHERRRPRIFVGNSLGGLVSIRFALRQPERVAALVLLSPAGTPMTPQEQERVFATFRPQSHRDGLAFVDRLMPNPGPLRHFVAWGVRRRLSDPNLQALLNNAEAEDFLTPGELSALEVPVLLFWGTQDGILPKSHFEFFRAHLPESATILHAHGFGHSPYLDDPDGLARRIRRFLREAGI